MDIISILGNIVGKTLTNNPQQALLLTKSGEESSALWETSWFSQGWALFVKESAESFWNNLECFNIQNEIFKINKLVDRHVLKLPLVIQIPKGPHTWNFIIYVYDNYLVIFRFPGAHMQYFVCWSSPYVISIRLCIIIASMTRNLIKRLYFMSQPW